MGSMYIELPDGDEPADRLVLLLEAIVCLRQKESPAWPGMKELSDSIQSHLNGSTQNEEPGSA